MVKFGRTNKILLSSDKVRPVEYLHERDIKLSIASNGYSLTFIPEETLSAFKDVEVSIDYSTQDEQDAWRGDQIELKLKMGPTKDLLRSKNVCTTIVT